MFTSRSVRHAALAWLLLLASTCLAVAAAASPTPAQEAALKKLLPKTLAKLQNREPLRVVSIGDNLSTFYQPAGFPRYDSSMAWHGRLLDKLGGLYYYHGIVDMEPHREITRSQKEAAADWEAWTQWQKNQKGPPPLDPDALRFRADLESPVAMPVGALIRRGFPASQQPEETAAIQIQNLARDGAQAAQALEALGPEAFPLPVAPGDPPAPRPDLVTICYGLNDALSGLPLEGYRYFLTQAVAICQKQGVEVLLAAPPVIFEPGQPRESLGRTRPYAQIAREVAALAKVAFVDLGAALVEGPSDLQSLTAGDAFSAALVPIARQFQYHSGIMEISNPNAASARNMGEKAAATLLNGPAASPVEITGGMDLTGPAEAVVQVRLFNPSAESRTIVISPLSFRGWQIKAGTPDVLFNLPPGKVRRFSIPLEAVSKPDHGLLLRGSLLVSDDDRQYLHDCSFPVRPLSLTWPEGRVDGKSGDMIVSTTLTNQSPLSVKGTATIKWMEKSQSVPISLDPNKSMPLPLRLAFPDPTATSRFSRMVSVSIALPDRTLRFERLVEGVQHIEAGKRFPLISIAPPAPGTPIPDPDTLITPVVDSGGLYIRIEAPSAGGSAGKADQPWGIIDVQLDGRKAGENGSAGFVDRLNATIPWSDGPVTLRKIRPSVFGETYFLDYSQNGFKVTATTMPDGSRRIEFNIARVNLLQHEWSLEGSGQYLIGFSVRVSRVDPLTGEFNPALTRVVANSPYGATDARSLTPLDISRNPSSRWSVKLY